MGTAVGTPDIGFFGMSGMNGVFVAVAAVAEKFFKPVAVYYGDVEAPDCKDKLYGAYNIFDKGRKK